VDLSLEWARITRNRQFDKLTENRKRTNRIGIQRRGIGLFNVYEEKYKWIKEDISNGFTQEDSMDF
jgi:hypothetical protein